MISMRLSRRLISALLLLVRITVQNADAWKFWQQQEQRGDGNNPKKEDYSPQQQIEQIQQALFVQQAEFQKGSERVAEILALTTTTTTEEHDNDENNSTDDITDNDITDNDNDDEMWRQRLERLQTTTSSTGNNNNNNNNNPFKWQKTTQKTLQRVREQDRNVREQLEQAHVDVDELVQQLTQREAELEQIQTESQECQNENQQLEQLIAQERQRVDQETNKCQTRLNEQDQQLQQLKADLETQHNMQEDILEERIAEAEDHWWRRLESAKNKTALKMQATTEAALEKTRLEHDQALQQVERMTATTNSLRNELNERERELAQVSDAAQGLANLQQDKDNRMQADRDRDMEEIEALTSMLRQREEEIQDLHNKLDTRESEQAKLVQRKVAEAEDEWWRRLAAAKNLTTSNIIAAKEKSLHQCRDEREQDRQQQRALQTNVDELRGTVKKRDREFWQVSETARTVTRLHQNCETRLIQERDAAQVEFRQLQERLEYEDEQRKALQREAADHSRDLDARVTEAQAEWRQRLEFAKNGTSLLDQMEREGALQKAREDRQDALEDLERTKAELEDLRGDIDGRQKRFSQVSQAAQGLAKLYEDFEKTKTEEHAAVVAELRAARTELQQKNDEIVELKVQLEDLGAEQDEMVGKRISEAEVEWFQRLTSAKKNKYDSILSNKAAALKRARKDRQEALESRDRAVRDLELVKQELTKRQESFAHISDTAESLAKLQEELERGSAEERARAENQVQRLEKKLRESEDEVRKLQVALEVKASHLERLESQMRETGLRGDLEQREKGVADVLEAAQGLSKLQETFQNRTREEQVRLSEELSRVRAVVMQRDEEVEVLQGKLAAKEEEQDRLVEKRVLEAEDEWFERLSAAKNNTVPKVEAARENALRECRNNRQRTWVQLSEASTRIEDLEQHLAESRKEFAQVSDAAQSLASLQYNFEKRTITERAELDQELFQLKASLLQKNQKVEELQATLAETKAAETKLIEQRLSEAEDQWWERLQTAKQSASLRQQMVTEATLQEVREAHQSALEDLRRAEDEIEALRDEISKRQIEFSQVSEAAQGLAKLYEGYEQQAKKEKDSLLEELAEANRLAEQKKGDVECAPVDQLRQLEKEAQGLRRELEARQRETSQVSEAAQTLANLQKSVQQRADEDKKRCDEEMEKSNKEVLRLTDELARSKEAQEVIVKRELSEAKREFEQALRTSSMVRKEELYPGMATSLAQAEQERINVAEKLNQTAKKLEVLQRDYAKREEEFKIVSDATQTCIKLKEDFQTVATETAETFARARLDFEQRSAERDARVSDAFRNVTGLLQQNEFLLQTLQEKVDGERDQQTRLIEGGIKGIGDQWRSKVESTNDKYMEVSKELKDVVVDELKGTRRELEATSRIVDDLRIVFASQQKAAREESQTQLGLEKIQMDLEKKTAEVQARTEEELVEVKSLLQQKDSVIQSLRDNLEERERTIDKRIKDAEEHWERGLATIESKNTLQAHDLQSEQKQKLDELELLYRHSLKEEEQKTRDAERDKAYISGEKQVIEKLYGDLEKKYEGLLRDMDAATEAYMKEHFEAAVRKRTDLLTSDWKNKFEDLEARSRDVLQEAEETTKRAIELYKVQVQKKTDSLMASHREELANREEAHERALITIQEELNHRTADLEEVQAKLRKYEDLVNKLNGDVLEKESSLSSLQQELSGVQETLRESMLAVDQLSTRNIELDAVLLELREALSDKNEKLSATSTKLLDVQRTLQESDGAVRTLTTENELVRAAMTELRDNKEQHVDATITELQNVKTESGNVLRDLKLERQKSQAVIRDLETRLNQASKEATYWSEVFKKRNYLNISHIHEGAMEVADTAHQAWTEIHSLASAFVSPFVQRSKNFYDSYLKRHVHKLWEAFQPHYNKLISPLVGMVSEAMSNTVQRLRATRDATMDGLVHQLQRSCLPALAFVSAVEQQVPFIRVFRQNLEDTCQQPKRSIIYALKAVAVIALIMSRGVIWSFLRGSTRVLFWTLLSPFRFCFKRHSPSSDLNGSRGRSIGTKRAAQ